LICSSTSYVDGNGNKKKALTITDGSGNKTNITSLEITYVTPPYQTILPSSPLTFLFELPTTTFNHQYDFVIAGINLNANLFYTSLAMGSIANYSISIQSLLRPGILSA
jgi:hypothetical protein